MFQSVVLCVSKPVICRILDVKFTGVYPGHCGLEKGSQKRADFGYFRVPLLSLSNRKIVAVVLCICMPKFSDFPSSPVAKRVGVIPPTATTRWTTMILHRPQTFWVVAAGSG